MWETLANNADWDCFKTPILQEILKTQNQHQEVSCVFSEVTRWCQSVGCVRNKLQFRAILWKLKIISLDAGLRLDGIPALDLWDLIVSVLGNTTQDHYRTGRPVVGTSEICSPPHTIHKRKQSHGMIDDLDNVDFFPSNVNSSHQEALLYVFDDNEAVIKMILEGKKPNNETCIQNPQSCS